MSCQLSISNAVLVANQFNPSIVSQIWLVDNQLLAREDFRPGCVFMDMMAQVKSREFNLLVTPEQLQFSPIGPIENHQAMADRVLCRIVETLPHTPYTAIGLNFAWHVKAERQGLQEYSRRLFFDPARPLHRSFDSEDARFGGYMSRNVLGCRLKLDVKPTILRSGGVDEELMQFSFNFHLDVAGTPNVIESIRGVLHRWDEARELTSQIMQTAQGNDA